jgi:MOSC domain-containing protein
VPDARIPASIDAIYRYPVKGLTAEPLESLALTAGQPVPFDRTWAIENGPSGFDPAEPAKMPKIKFLMLMKHERLAALQTSFDEETSELTILRHGKRVAGGKLDDPLGRQLIEQFFSAYMSEELRGAPKILSTAGHTFSDVGLPVVSIINLASLRELERVAGRPVDPLRFRANVYIDGWQPWQEFTKVGEDVALGNEVVVKIVDRIVRCAATNVDPQTAERDMQIPRLLDRAFGHSDLGVYAEIVRGGTISNGDTVSDHPT